jgi:hypothetical protein
LLALAVEVSDVDANIKATKKAKIDEAFKSRIFLPI